MSVEGGSKTVFHIRLVSTPHMLVCISDLLCNNLNGYPEHARAEEGRLSTHGGKVDKVLQDELYAALGE